MRLLLVCVILYFSASLALAGDDPPAVHNVFVLVGYSDDLHIHGIKDIFSHEQILRDPLEIRKQLNQHLLANGFERATDVEVEAKDPNDDNHFSAQYFNPEKGLTVSIVDANVFCRGEKRDPQEDDKPPRRIGLCRSQRQWSENLVRFLNQHLTQYDEFIYLGHSRLGRGLGIGPFYGDFVYDLEFSNEVAAGNLKRVFIASCNSVKYYKDRIAKHTHIQFLGTEHKEEYWVDVPEDVKQKSLLDDVLQELSTGFN